MCEKEFSLDVFFVRLFDLFFSLSRNLNPTFAGDLVLFFFLCNSLVRYSLPLL